MINKSIELLSPAKDLECGIAAINCGADAVYIGAPKFGARVAAGNSIEDIQKLVEYAHKFWAKVYATVNTIIYDEELEEVQKLITKLYEINVDAIIFQDMAILEMDIPPIQLFASTQTHNYDLERIKFLDQLGINRIILARELSIEQIKNIRKKTKAGLEFFVHGALCVCLSGQCYMSAAMFGRSSNRGECAQPCRLKYSLVDKNGKVIIKDKHLLSLRDLNLSAYLNELMEAGITSFKIEGRLKDIGYVKNITAYYRRKLDSIIENNPILKRASSGDSKIPFEPDPDKTFNRGYTSYFIDGKDGRLGSIDTPKSTGKLLGKVIKTDKNFFTVDTNKTIINGDGLCYFNDATELEGMNVSKVEANTVFTNDMKGIIVGTIIYRNYDHAFSYGLKMECLRKIKANISIDETSTGIRIMAKDEDNISVILEEHFKKEPAKNKEQALETFRKQFSKSGDTIFEVTDIEVNLGTLFFIPVKQINMFRRRLLELLEKERIRRHNKNKHDFQLSTRLAFDESKRAFGFIQKKLDYKYNIVNKLSKKFYGRFGAEEIEEGFELQKDNAGKTLMTCKYCIKDELGMCRKTTEVVFEKPLYLTANKRKYRLIFNCIDCQMEIINS
jgi:putative protease